MNVIKGSTAPKAEEKTYYEVGNGLFSGSQSLFLTEEKEEIYTWTLFKGVGGKWIHVANNIKHGKKVPYTFGEKVVGVTYKIVVNSEGKNLFNQLENKFFASILVTPRSAREPLIGRVILLNRGKQNVNKATFNESLSAQARTANLVGKEITFYLWEEGGSEDDKYKKPKKARVNKNGIAEVKFNLIEYASQPLLMQIFNFNSKTTKKFFVTAVYDNKKATNKGAVEASESNSTAPKKEDSGGILSKGSEVLGEGWKNIVDAVEKALTATSVGKKDLQNKNSTCICKEEYKDLIWGGKVNCEFRKKVVQICADLWGESRKMEMANGLMAVMNVETSGSFKAHQIMGKPLGDVNAISKNDFWLIKTDKNGKVISKTSRAIGLIQFTQSALQAMGEFKTGSGFEKLHEVKLNFATMGEVKQLDKVKKYFQNQKDNIKSPEDIYLAVFAPKGVGKSDDYVLYEKGTVEYSQNASVDTKSTGVNKNDGNIQRSEILERYNDSFGKGENNKVKVFNCSTTEKKQDKQDTGKWHDPLDICQRTKYNYSGGQNIEGGAFGKVRNSETKNHQGIDLFAIPGNTVYACVDGTVVEQRLSDSGGNLVTIQIKNKQDLLDRKTQINYQIQFDSKGDKGEQTSAVNFSLEKDENLYLRYYHLSEVNVQKGDSVTSGEVIGKTGVTGNASGTKGPHLHFEILNTTGYPHGLSNRMNPAFFIKLQAINDKEQDRDCKFKYYKDGTKK